MNIKYPFRLTLITISVLFFSWAIIVQIIQILNSELYVQAKEEEKIEIIPANRGNIYTANNRLLAVTSSKYDVRFDGVYAESSVSKSDLYNLSQSLFKIFKEKSSSQYLKDLEKKNQFSLIKRNASFKEISELKELPYYNKTLQGGVIIKTVSSREKPNGNSAARTIGDLYQNKAPKYGLEYSYNSELMGQDGKCLFLYKPGAGKIKIKDTNNLDPRDGRDLITTINLDYQDILEDALLRQLELYEADFGTAILMEVSTGKIKAITNLKKTKKNKYAEILNFGVTRQIEPGSTMKLASVMAYLEDYNGNIDDTIDCKNGTYRFKGSPIDTRDSKKLGVVSIEDAFAYSSNIGIGRLIHKNYEKSPEKFIDRIYSFGLGEKSKIDLVGVPTPNIPSPSSSSWSGISLPWISFGYGVNLTPLDILTFYNSVANDGYLIHPYLGDALREGSRLMRIKRNKISHTICSKETVQKIKILLREVVKKGTGNSMLDLPFSVSGKTGTTVKNYDSYLNNHDKQYQSSFVGFFPSESPKYSCIVLIDSPNNNLGYYGSVVAVPVFKEIAKKLYIQEGLTWYNDVTQQEQNLDSFRYTNHNISNITNISESSYPNVVGMHVRDALAILNSAGYKVIVKGDFGNVKSQYPKPETKVIKELAITLFI